MKKAAWLLGQMDIPQKRSGKLGTLRVAVILDEPVHEAEVTVEWANIVQET